MSKKTKQEKPNLNPHKITSGGSYVVQDGKAVKQNVNPKEQAKGSEAKSAKTQES